MIILISPSKTMDIVNNSPSGDKEYMLTSYTTNLRDIINTLSNTELKTLYKASDKVVTQAIELNQCNSTYRAITLFNGAVFKNLDYATLNTTEQNYINEHVHIFSGLYGLIPCSKSIKPYRYDLNNTLNPKIQKATTIFKPEVTRYLTTQDDKLIIDLASSEYRTLIDYKALNHYGFEVISFEFKDNKKGTYKSLGTYAKMARGQFLRQLSRTNCQTVHELKAITVMNYCFNEELSTKHEFVYTRE